MFMMMDWWFVLANDTHTSAWHIEQNKANTKIHLRPRTNTGTKLCQLQTILILITSNWLYLQSAICPRQLSCRQQLWVFHVSICLLRFTCHTRMPPSFLGTCVNESIRKCGAKFAPRVGLEWRQKGAWRKIVDGFRNCYWDVCNIIQLILLSYPNVFCECSSTMSTKPMFCCMTVLHCESTAARKTLFALKEVD